MGLRTEYQPGTFCWPELATTDSTAAKEFYGGLMGWQAIDMPTEQDSYSFWQLNEKTVGAMYQMAKEPTEQGIPPHWICYASVENINNSLEKLKALGGSVSLGPYDVGEAGRMAFVKDPQGASFALWQPLKNAGAEIVNDPGTLCWNELATNDAAAAEKFYCELFGWSAHTEEMSMGPYTVFNNGKQAAGGVMQMTEEWGDIPPHWMTYFAVSDPDGDCAKVQSLGGSICVEPFDVPEVGRIAVINDPQGATFSIIKLDAPDP